MSLKHLVTPLLTKKSISVLISITFLFFAVGGFFIPMTEASTAYNEEERMDPAYIEQFHHDIEMLFQQAINEGRLDSEKIIYIEESYNETIGLSSGVGITLINFATDEYQMLLEHGESIMPELLYVSYYGQDIFSAWLACVYQEIAYNLGIVTEIKEVPYLDWDLFLLLFNQFIGFYNKPGPILAPLPPNPADPWMRANEYCQEKGYFNVIPADPSVFVPIPEEPNNPPYLRWEPMLGCWVAWDAYYNEELGFIIEEKPIDHDYWDAVMYPGGE